MPANSYEANLTERATWGGGGGGGGRPFAMFFFLCLLNPGGNFSKAIVQQKLRSLEHPHPPGLNQATPNVYQLIALCPS